MVIKREGNLFVVYQDRESLFRSTSFEECKRWVKTKGNFYKIRRAVRKRHGAIVTEIDHDPKD